jgi:hypothetical protein
MDSVKMGLICITLICISIGVTGMIFAPPDKKVEIAMGAFGGASLIGGWLGHAALSGKDTGQDQPSPTSAPPAA